MAPIDTSEARALALDAADPLRGFRSRFHLLPGIIYMDGNSLGLLSREAEAALLQTLDEWRTCGVSGWFTGDSPWFHRAERVGALMASLMGAEPEAVIHSATVTVNIHALVSSFYQPAGARVKILADSLNFPTDLYALQGQLKLRGRDPGRDLVLVPSPDGRTLDERTIVDLMTEEVALVFLPSVLYRSGQLLDVAYLAAAARERGIPLGLDCSHSAGAVVHRLDEWGVDFAVWCSYKYLNGGPGASAFLYVNRRHWNREPLLCGWFGNDKETQFEMDLEFRPQATAGRWQISSPGILGSSTLLGSLAVIAEAGVERIRARSLALTGYLMELIGAELTGADHGLAIGTPREPGRRGGHVAVEIPSGAAQVCEALIERGIVPDFRPPDVIRFCPSPLYGTFHEVWRTVQILGEVTCAS